MEKKDKPQSVVLEVQSLRHSIKLEPSVEKENKKNG